MQVNLLLIRQIVNKGGDAITLRRMKQFVSPPSFWVTGVWIAIYGTIKSLDQIMHFIGSNDLKVMIGCLVFLVLSLIIASIVDRSNYIDTSAEKENKIERLTENNKGLQEQYKSDKEAIKELNAYIDNQSRYISYLEFFNKRLSSSVPEYIHDVKRSSAIDDLKIKELRKHAGVQSSQNNQ